MAKPDPSRKRTGCRRLFVWALVLCLVVVAALGALLFTGAPQRIATQILLSSQLNGQANVASVSLRNPLGVQGLTLAGRASRIYGPVLKVGSVDLRYDVSPQDGRYLRSVDLSGIRLSLQQGETENNFQFLLDRFAQPGGGGGTDLTPWIPERVGVSDLWVELNFPSYYLRMDGIDFETDLANATQGSLALDATNTGIAWSSVYTPGGQQTGSGAVTIEADWNGSDVDLDASIDLGPLARIQGTASLMHRDGDPFFALSLPEASLEDPLWAAAVTDLSPVAARFDRVSLKDSEIHVHQSKGQLIVDQATVDADIPSLSIGPVEAPYYDGPVSLSVRGNYGDQTTITGKLTLFEDTTIDGSFQWGAEGLKGTFESLPWKRERLVRMLPAEYASTLDIVAPLNALGASGTLEQSPGLLRIAAKLTGNFGKESALQVPIEYEQTTDQDTSNIVIKSDVTLFDGNVRSEISLLPESPVTISNEIHNVQINPWAEYLMGNPLVPWFSGHLSGTARVAMPADQPLEVDLALTGEKLRYGDLALPEEEPVHLEGKLAYDLATGVLASRDAHLEQAGVVDLKAKTWSLNLNTAAMKLGLESTLSLDAVAAIFGLEGLYGNAAINGELAVGPEKTSLDGFTASSEDLGYGDYSVPYGETLNLAGGLAYARGPNTLQFAPIQAAIGEGARFASDSLTFRFPSEEAAFTMEIAPLDLQSDLEILVQRGILGSVSNASLSVKSERFAWNGEHYDGVVSWDIAADTLEMPDDMALLEQVAWSGRYNPGDEEDGGGRLTVGSFSIYKIPFGAADTQLRVTPEHLTCDSLETTFLGGGLQLSGKIDYHDPTFPALVKASVSELDLEEFTRTFEPPDVVLTGKVNGTADIALSTEGLVDLQVDLTASENLTLNRTMVRQILMSQYVNDAVGSKSVQKVIEKVIGKDEQRPFEKAVLQLRLEDGFIRGIARLESKSLDVTVDINAEPEAILQAILSTTENL